MLNTVRYLADSPEVNTNLNDMYGDLKDKTQVDKAGDTVGTDIVNVAKWALLIGGVIAIVRGFIKMVHKGDKKAGGFMIFGGVLMCIIGTVIFVTSK
ncbi:MAG: hypothetical protein ACLRK7_08545 [Streptococcus salivarius]|jgi:hypothetical protein